MKKYKIEWLTNGQNGDRFTTYDENEAKKEFQKIIEDERTTEAALTEYYIYSIYQGENLIQEYTRGAALTI